MTPNDLHALTLLNELQRLADPNQPAAIRLTIRSAEGDYIGEAVLPAAGTEHATQAVSAVADYANRDPEAFTTPTLDPLLVADLDDHFADIDPDSFLDDVFNSPDAEASLAAFEQLATGEYDGGL